MRTIYRYLRLFVCITLLSAISTLFVLSSFANNYTQMSLPKGAIARLGKGAYKDILYSPDGKIFAVVSSIGIWLYDTKDYQELTLLPIPLNHNRPIALEITNTTFSIDGQTIVSETDQKSILMWNVFSGERKVISMHKNVSYSNDRQTLTIDSEKTTIELWHGKKEIIVKPERKYGDIDIIIAYSPDRNTYAIVDDKHNIRIMDTRKQKLSKYQIKYLNFPYGQKIYLSPDAKTLATLIPDSPIRLWDVGTSKIKNTLTGHIVKQNPIEINTRYSTSFPFDSIAFSPDGKILANGSLEGTIRLWNIDSGKLTRTLKGQFGFIKSLSYSPDGKLLASGSEDGSILVWNTETEEHEPFIAERMNSISCVSFSRDGNMLAGGCPNGDIFLFDVATGQAIKTFTGHIAEINQLIFNPDNSKLASIGWDGSVRLWDIETEEIVKTISLPISVHFRSYWREILFTEHGNLLAINSEYDFIHIWNVNTGEYKQNLMGHVSHLRSFSINGERQTLASFSADGTILLWDLSDLSNETN